MMPAGGEQDTTLWIHQHIRYQKGSIATTSAVDVYEARAGVCRDFAHTGVVFCRAMNIPARYVFGYLPDVGIEPPDEPMDFHAWFEAYVVGALATSPATCWAKVAPMRRSKCLYPTTRAPGGPSP